MRIHFLFFKLKDQSNSFLLFFVAYLGRFLMLNDRLCNFYCSWYLRTQFKNGNKPFHQYLLSLSSFAVFVYVLKCLDILLKERAFLFNSPLFFFAFIVLVVVLFLFGLFLLLLLIYVSLLAEGLQLFCFFFSLLNDCDKNKLWFLIFF